MTTELLNIEDLPYCVAIVGRDGVITRCNDRLKQAIVEDPTGWKVEELLPEGLREAHNESMRQFWMAPRSRPMIRGHLQNAGGGLIGADIHLAFRKDKGDVAVLIRPQ